MLDLQENIYAKAENTYYRRRWPTSSGCFGLNINAFLEVPNNKYGSVLYLLDYTAYGLHVWYNT